MSEAKLNLQKPPKAPETAGSAGLRREDREPLFHLSKRSSIPFWKSWLIRLIAIALSLGVCGLVAYALSERMQNGDKSVQDLFQAFMSGSFKTNRMMWQYFSDTAKLLCISLALVPAFRMRYWNIGGEGQTLVGVLGAIAVNFYYGKDLPEGWLLLLMLLAGILCGAVWGLIPSIFRAIWGTNETLFTLMMNYVAQYLSIYYVLIWAGKNSSMRRLKQGNISTIAKAIGMRTELMVVLIVLLVAVGLYIYLNYTKHGYEINVVGESVRTARYVGINEKKVVIRTAILSGALCGLAGFLIAAQDMQMTDQSAGGLGFTGIMVAWLGKNNPLIMILTAAFIMLLDHGAAQISTDLDVPDAFPSVLVGIILFFIIGCEFFIQYQVHFRSHHERAKGGTIK